MTTRLLPALFCLLAASGSAEPAAPIATQPLGEVDAARLAVVRTALAAMHAGAVEVLPGRPLPKEAWYAPRSRYRAEKLLDFLGRETRTGHRIVVGVTTKDISTTKDGHEDWGIFGLGELGGRACVVSTFRLGGRGAGEAKLRERLAKVAVHEAGHVMGLPHCPHRGCVMQDAEGSIATVDGETGTPCADCGAKLAAWVRRAQAQPAE